MSLNSMNPSYTLKVMSCQLSIILNDQLKTQLFLPSILLKAKTQKTFNLLKDVLFSH